MLESIILGTVQGIAEWLPVSSEGLLVLTQVKLFGSEAPLEELIRISLFLHLGTFFASLIYFWADIKKLTALLAGYLTRKRSTETAEPADRKVLGFLLTATVITGTIGVLLLFGLKGIEDKIELGGREVM
ncbi:MAG: undecaprenyl-diphosphate phosphatase, partial [Candidatus Spechtbacteria bacterium]|nr:undecaprenyl-diphosphate phosphatase [Candidatus Spechtbacteria bacterium]